MSKMEDLLKQDWYIKLDSEGKEITPEMGKPSMLSKKKFIADIETKIKSRQEILNQIAIDKAQMKGESETCEIILDSDDNQRDGIWSDD